MSFSWKVGSSAAIIFLVYIFATIVITLVVIYDYRRTDDINEMLLTFIEIANLVFVSIIVISVFVGIFSSRTIYNIIYSKSTLSEKEIKELNLQPKKNKYETILQKQNQTKKT
jgi:magnesium-transporting ATPase (P-type)